MSRRLLCDSKQDYGTPGAAAKKVRERQRVERQRLYAYKCQACGGYHLTKLKPPPDVIVSLITGKCRRETT